MMERIFGPKKLTKEQKAIQATRVEDRDKAEAMADASRGDRSFAADMRKRAQEHKDVAKIYDKDSYEAKDLNFAAQRNLNWATERDQSAEVAEDAAAVRYDYLEKLKNMSDDQLKMALQEVLAYKEQAVIDADTFKGEEREEKYRIVRQIDSEAQMIAKMIKARKNAEYTNELDAIVEDFHRKDGEKIENTHDSSEVEFLKRKLNAEYDAHDENLKRESGEGV
ncbi:MAG: hypothetical protein WC783_04785 [Candidatus Paceibacterota bacterium]